MENGKMHRIPTRDPISGGRLFVSELTGEASGITIRGQFELPKYAQLDAEQAHFLETFLRCRGILSCVEKELGISYPTVRTRLDALLEALGLSPAKEEPKDAKGAEKRRAILDDLEKGAITAAEAKARLKGVR